MVENPAPRNSGRGVYRIWVLPRPFRGRSCPRHCSSGRSGRAADDFRGFRSPFRWAPLPPAHPSALLITRATLAPPTLTSKPISPTTSLCPSLIRVDRRPDDGCARGRGAFHRQHRLPHRRPCRGQGDPHAGPCCPWPYRHPITPLLTPFRFRAPPLACP